MATKVPKSWSSSSSSSSSSTTSKQNTTSESTTQKVLDEKLLATILGGLMGKMTQDEIEQFAENLLRPQLNAGLEASQQQYETTELAKKQEIENLAAALSKSIEEQNRAYRQSMADVETAALARGMGRSSYTLQSLANQGDALARAVMQLTDENARQSAQIQAQITQAAQQNAQTQGRLNTDYASQLAAKIQELTQQQRQEYNSNYLTAISAAMGSQTTGSSETLGESQTNSSSSSSTVSGTYKSSSSGSGTKTSAPSYTTHQSGGAANKNTIQMLN